MRPSLTFCLAILFIGLAGYVYVLVAPKIRRGPHSDIPSAMADIYGGIKTALIMYEVDNGYYPKSLQELVQQPSGATNWHGPYLDKMPTDPWGNGYIYAYPGKRSTNAYDLMSAGADGKAGTEDDIGNW